jgi:hypothetical protein
MKKANQNSEVLIKASQPSQLPVTIYHLPITNDKLCETNPISQKPKMNLTLYMTKNYDNKSGLLTMAKQTQTNPISGAASLNQGSFKTILSRFVR